jgi:cellulose synthase/poly-beta-1,6-N-acetylglucosamine synthase-like glycosyltransferase
VARRVTIFQPSGSDLEISDLIQLLTGTVLLGLGVAVSLSLLYHYILAIAGWSRPRPLSEASEDYRFAVLIPAHNEESVLASTLETLTALKYPRDRWDAYVVADHCTDGTAALAREYGGICLEREDGRRGRKAYALQWLVQELFVDPRQYDAFVIIDADSHLDPLFLQRVRDGLSAGHDVLQGQHRVANARQSFYTQLADIDMRLNNLLRNQAKRNLRLSARLMGDAMCFRRSILERFGWPTESLGEDREFGMYLVARGLRVTYLPDAVSYGQGVLRWRDAGVQRLRWQAASTQIRRAQMRDVARRAIETLDPSAVDLLVELVVPSFSVSAFLSFVLLAVQRIVFPSAPRAMSWGAFALCLLSVCFPIVGLVAARAPLQSFGALLLGPAFVTWRVLLRLRVLLFPSSVKWIRTVRSEELGK